MAIGILWGCGFFAAITWQIYFYPVHESNQQYMARADGAAQHWETDELLYSSRDSDDSPILSYRHEKNRKYAPYIREGKTEDRERRSTFSVLAKFFLFSSAMILFCVLLYIPVYNKANDQVLKPAVAGWSIHTNRDTKIYVQPENVTTIHEPKDVCPKSSRKDKNKLFLLIVVCSSTVNFEQRVAIRETWGNYKNYLKLSRIFHAVKEKYKNYNASDLEVESTDASSNRNLSIDNLDRIKRDISGFGQLLPELAKALQNNLADANTEPVEEKRFDDEKEDDKMLPEFDMNKVIGDQEEDTDFDYDYGSNIMKIPPKGYEDTPDVGRIISLLKHVKTFPKMEETEPDPGNTERDFKLVFLLGLPPHDNDTNVQDKIENEVETYGDIIQEGFVDSYNNLTLKSIMMLKWVTNNCNESVRYILKTDDDMYINVPNLVSNLHKHAKAFDDGVAKGNKSKEYLLIGRLICGARPVQDSKSKWYSPRYMYAGRVYPRYLSGTGYVMSAPTTQVLYSAALVTSYFHLEDIYITGMCAIRSSPRIVPRDEAGFSYEAARGGAGGACVAHARVSVHRVPPPHMRALAHVLMQTAAVERCERKHLMQVRNDRLRKKVHPTASGTKLRASLNKVTASLVIGLVIFILTS